MSSFPFLLVVIAAVTHACWNFASKQVSGNITTSWLGFCMASTLAVPAAVLIIQDKGFVDSALPYIIYSGIIHAAYFFFMSKAYKKGDISTVYPVARGTGVICTTVLAFSLLKETLSPLGYFAVVLIAGGIISFGFRISGKNATSIVYALLEGITIAGYSLVDKAGVDLINPVVFIAVSNFVTILCLAPFILYYHYDHLKKCLKKDIKYSLIIGFGSTGTYLLILFAFRLSQVSYVVAAREFSVVIGSILGFKLLDEQFSIKKGLGIAAITLGLIVMKVS